MANQDADKEAREVEPEFLVCIGCKHIPRCRRIKFFSYRDYKIVDDKVVWFTGRLRVNPLVVNQIMKDGYCPDHSIRWKPPWMQ